MQKIAKHVLKVLSGDKMDVTIEFLMKKIYIHYRIITKHLLRGCFMISSLSYDNIIMIPKRRFINKIEIRIFYKSVFGWGSGGGGHFINPLTPLLFFHQKFIRW